MMVITKRKIKNNSKGEFMPMLDSIKYVGELLMEEVSSSRTNLKL